MILCCMMGGCQPDAILCTSKGCEQTLLLFLSTLLLGKLRRSVEKAGEVWWGCIRFFNGRMGLAGLGCSGQAVNCQVYSLIGVSHAGCPAGYYMRDAVDFDWVVLFYCVICSAVGPAALVLQHLAVSHCHLADCWGNTR
jgi:hypothetical protein